MTSVAYWNLTCILSPTPEWPTKCWRKFWELIVENDLFSLLLVSIRFTRFWKGLLITVVLKYRIVYCVLPFWKIRLNLIWLRRTRDRTSIRALCMLLHEAEETSVLWWLSCPLPTCNIPFPSPWSLGWDVGLGREKGVTKWELQSSEGGWKLYYQPCLGVLLSPLH